MAQLFPSSFPKQYNINDPEFIVFQTLAKLPEHYQVFYSKKFKGGDRVREECEVDFIIFDGKKSLLVMEVKGGLISYDGEGDYWTQNSKKLKVSPDRQASAATAAVIEFLSPEIMDINVGWCLCFPNCSMPTQKQRVSLVPAQLIIDEEGLVDIEHSISNISSYYEEKHKRPGASKGKATQIIQKLTRGIQFVTKTGVRLARDSSQIAEVTTEQLEVLEDLEINRRLIVRGCAGSGKTLLATEFARRLSERGEKVLLLFYNKELSRVVSRSFDRDASVTASTFHRLAKRAIEAQDPSWWADNKSSKSEFWELEIPIKFCDLDFSKLDKFDAIIIDEGQDFKSLWYEAIEELLEDPKDSRLVVFYDEHQDIFSRWEELPWGSSGVAKKVLTKNCRNTKSIVSYLNEKCGSKVRSFERSPEGLEVVEQAVTSTEDELRLLRSDLSNLVKEGVSPDEIVILIESKKADSCLAETETIAGVQLQFGMRSRSRDRTPKIKVVTISEFKGLEALVIFVLSGSNQNQCEKIEYTQFSRAKASLYVYRLDSAENKLLANSQ